jgi:hypothetical protein
MKRTVLGLLLLVGMVCAYAQGRITVESDIDDDVDFSKYKTFSWASQVDSQLDERGVYFLNDLILKAQIREAVKSELMGLGYQLDPNQPDLIVNFRVFDQAARIKGVEPEYWSGQTYGLIGDTTSYEVKPGTILLSLADRKKSKVVFQGFASGLIDNDHFIKDEVRIRQAVHMIADESGLKPKDLSKKD